MGKFSTAKVIHVSRGQNRHANSLATLASAMTEDVPHMIKVDLITESNINTMTDVGIARICVTTVSTRAVLDGLHHRLISQRSYLRRRERG